MSLFCECAHTGSYTHPFGKKNVGWDIVIHMLNIMQSKYQLYIFTKKAHIKGIKIENLLLSLCGL